MAELTKPTAGDLFGAGTWVGIAVSIIDDHPVWSALLAIGGVWRYVVARDLERVRLALLKSIGRKNGVP